MTKQVLESILEVSKYTAYSEKLFCFVGYKTKELSYEDIEKMQVKKIVNLKILLQNYINKPLNICIGIGSVCCFVAISLFL